MDLDGACPAPPVSHPVFVGVVAFVFALCAGATVGWCLSMQTMPELPMPGGWFLSMTWVPMCGQKWPHIAMSFVGMWIVMMMAMMLPSLAPALWRYHEVLAGTGKARAHCLTVLAGIAYFFAWAVLGALVFALGFAFMTLAMQLPLLSRSVPVAASLVVLAAGVLQFSRWKMRHLTCARFAASRREGSACMHGVRLGVHCVACCAGLTAVLLVNGMMDLRAMTLATLAITAERLAPAPESVAKAIGVVVVVIGLSMFEQAMALL